MKKLIIVSTPFLLGLILMIVSAFTPSTVDRNGMLHEPYFFLIPVSMLCIFIGIIVLAIYLIRSVKRYKKA